MILNDFWQTSGLKIFSVQSPHASAAILFCDIIADIVHITVIVNHLNEWNYMLLHHCLILATFSESSPTRTYYTNTIPYWTSEEAFI